MVKATRGLQPEPQQVDGAVGSLAAPEMMWVGVAATQVIAASPTEAGRIANSRSRWARERNITEIL
jgi:hypothetical protein